MSDDNQANDQDRKTGGAISEFFENGGILQAALGKAGAKAITRLVGGVADIPAAVLENIAQRIRNDTKARSKVTEAIATAASKKASKDPQVIDRAIERWTGVEVRKQENREAVAERTVEYLKQEPPTDPSNEGPNNDFMNLFESLAENASSEKLQDLFARVLAGEIRRTGTFSLRTLQVISVMDQNLAEKVTKLRKWTTGNFIVKYEGMNKGDKFNTLMVLSDFGLVRIGLFNTTVKISEDGVVPLTYASKCIAISGDPGNDISIPANFLTPVGSEIISLLPPDEDLELIQDSAAYLKSIPGVNGVKIGDITDLRNGYFKMSNLVEV